MQDDAQRAIYNLFREGADLTKGESFSELLRHANISIERIVSPAKTRSQPFLQAHDEWVALLQGNAILELEGRKQQLTAGDSLLIPAYTPHRVLDTSADPLCIWLAVHIHPDTQGT